MPHPLRIVLLSSRVTYSPKNYGPLFQAILENQGDYMVTGTILYQNQNSSLWGKALGLLASGVAPRIGGSLLYNTLYPDPKVKQAKRHQIPIHMTPDLHAASTLQWFHDCHADLLVHLRTRVKLQPPWLNVTPLGAINLHHGHLPQFQGTLCDLRQMVAGLPGSFSVHQMVEQMDQGRILLRHNVATAEQCQLHYGHYLKRCLREECAVLIPLLRQIAQNRSLPPSLNDSDSESLYPWEQASAGKNWYRTPGLQELKEWKKQGWRF